jgi:ketosteroid isomerase-like protein
MNAQENKQVVMEGYQKFMRGDIPGVLARCHDDAEWISPETETAPFSGSFHGMQGLADFFTKLDASLQAIRYEPREFIAEGDKVVAIGEATWLVKSTGRQFDTPWMHVFTFRGDKIARIQALTDTAAGERAFRSDQAGQTSTTGSQLHH